MKVCSMVSFALVAFVSTAAEYEFQFGATDFSQIGSYRVSGVVPDALPGADDTIVLPSGTFAVEVPSASYTALNAVKLVRPHAGGSKLVLTVDSGDYDFNPGFGNAAVAYSSHAYGELVKRGDGTLRLTANRALMYGSSFDLSQFCDLTVERGMLYGPVSSENLHRMQGVLSISNSATYVMRKAVPSTAYNYYFGLIGDGLVTNDTSDASSFYVQCRYAKNANERLEFSGRIGGAVTVMADGNGAFTGTESTYSGSFAALFPKHGDGLDEEDYTVGVKKFGRAGEPSSIGTAATFSTSINGGRFRYLGIGETTDKSLAIKMRSLLGPIVMDAGPTGGLVFEGGSIYSSYDSDSFWTFGLELTGSNRNDSVVSVPVNGYSYQGTDYPIHIKKSGTGTWTLRGAAALSENAGAFTVESGCLKYDSLAEKGSPCAFGLSTNLRSFVQLQPLKNPTAYAASEIPWAFTMGAAGTEGELEYIGTNRGVCTTRPIGLIGNARFSNSGTHTLHWGGASVAVAGAERTLTLDGSGMHDEFTDLSDGVGRLNVVKEGSGCWTIGGNLDFSGTLRVKQGTLVLQAPDAPYTWFRFTIEKCWSAFPHLQEIALYNADGERENVGLSYARTLTRIDGNNNQCARPSVVPAELLPGSVTLAQSSEYAWYNPSSERDLGEAFDDVSKNPAWIWQLGQGGASYPNGSAARAITLVMRLRDSAKEITAYDLCAGRSAFTNQIVTAWSFEGSRDGLVWETLTNVSLEAEGLLRYKPSLVGSGGYLTNDRWYSRQKGETYLFTKDFSTGRKLSADDPGFPLRGKSISAGLSPAFSIKVEKDGVLKAKGSVSLSALTLETAGMGSLENVSFASTGVLTVEGILDKNEIMISADFSKTTGYVNLVNWQLKTIGIPRNRYVISRVTEAGITLVRSGTLLIVR